MPTLGVLTLVDCHSSYFCSLTCQPHFVSNNDIIYNVIVKYAQLYDQQCSSFRYFNYCQYPVGCDYFVLYLLAFGEFVVTVFHLETGFHCATLRVVKLKIQANLVLKLQTSAHVCLSSTKEYNTQSNSYQYLTVFHSPSSYLFTQRVRLHLC